MRKKLLLSFLALSGLLTGQRLYAQDYDVEVDGIYYKYDTEKLVATVVQAPYDAPYTGDIIIPASFTRGRFSFDVTAVGNNAFANSKATSVKFETDGEKGVTSIGTDAFSWSYSLTEVKLPTTLTTLGKRAFYNCSALRELTIPNGVTALNEYTFTGCSSLETVNLPEEMPEAAIGESAFERCGITSITLPKGMLYTGKNAFDDCTKLKTVNFPDDWQYINSGMFAGCTSLSSITFPSTLLGILTGSFQSCPLEKLTIPASVTALDWTTFWDCYKLKELKFEDGQTAINVYGTSLDDDELEALETLYMGRDFKNTDDDLCPPALKNLTIGANVTSIPYSFGNAIEVIHSKIKDPSSVTENFTSKVKSNAKLYVPKGTYDAYCNATGWSKFFFIEEEEGGEQSVIIITADDKTVEYGEKIPEFTYTVKGGTLEGKPDLSTVARQFSDVGQYPISVAKGTLTYEWLYFVNGTLTITKAPLTVGVQDITITEGDDIPAFTLTYSGFKGAQTETVLSTLPVATTTATSGSPAGTYPITISGGSATNYSLSYTSGTLTIVQKEGSGTSVPNYSFDDQNKTATVIAKENETYEGEITIPATVEKDGNTYKVIAVDANAFKGSSVIWVKLPEGLTTIGNEAFADCARLTHITLPSTLKKIGTKAFYGSNVLKYIQTFMTAPISISANTFSEWTYAKAAVFIPYSSGYTLRTKYEKANEWKKFHAFVTTDDDPYLMTDIPNAQGVVLNIFITDPEAKKAVLGTAITNMPAVDIDTAGEVIIPETLGGYTITKINNAAFMSCQKMTAVTLPKTITDIGWMGFDDCFGLTDVTVEAETPFPFSNADYAFPAKVYRLATLHVPAGTVDAYRNCEGWKEFDNIEEISTAIKGDVNGDKVVDVADIASVITVMADSVGSGSPAAAVADVNGDKVVDVADIASIITIMAAQARQSATE